MITFSNAGKRFGPKLLFDGVDWMITPNDRIGLVGANGTGKSTLLKVIAGFEQLDMGERLMAKGLRHGYLPQDGLTLSGRSVFNECLSVFAGLHDMEREMDELAHRMSDVDPASEEYAAIGDRFHDLQSHFQNLDGYSIDSQVGSVLSGLGFSREDWQRRTEEFSGGWQMRIALGKLLLEKPNILLLDEPTNHLDLEARNWLEDYLKSYPNAFLLISHDRYFLDVTVEKIAEIWNKKITIFKANYTRFQELKSERLELLRAAQKNQRDRIDALEAFIGRFRAQATKAKQVQSRIKELEKIERIDIPPEEKTIHFSFPQPKPSGRVVAEFIDVGKAYGSKRVFSGARFVIERGDRIALVGHNGAGKSTMIKLLSGEEPLTEGELKLGHNVGVDYFAQDQYKVLDADSTVFNDLRGLAPRRTETELRSLLGCFLFSEDDVFKKIGVLSGGERNRYALARMLLQPSNFLLLDEPTNHLDMRAKDVLLTAMEEFQGTIVFVSHDRYFIDKLATRVVEIQDGRVTDYPGNYEDYVWRKSGGAEQFEAAQKVEAKPSAPVAVADASPKKKVNPQRMKTFEDRCAAIEAELESLDEQVARQEAELGVFKSADESARLASEIEAARSRMASLEAEWEEAAASLELIR